MIQRQPILNLINQCSQPLVLETQSLQESEDRLRGIPPIVQIQQSKIPGYVFQEDSKIPIESSAVIKQGKLKAVVFSTFLSLSPKSQLLFEGKRYSVEIESHSRDSLGEIIAILNLTPI